MNKKFDFRRLCRFCWDLSNVISGGNWLFRWAVFFQVGLCIHQPPDAQVNPSQFVDDIAIWAQALGICSINLRLQKYLNQILTWCDRCRIKLNPGKRHLINFSQRKVINDSSITMYGHLLKVTDTVKFLGVHIDKHLNMKQNIEYIERASLISRMRITRLNSINTTLLIRLYKIFTRPYMDYACLALTTLHRSQRQKLEVIQNSCLRYARRAVDSACISNNELRSRCNIVSVATHSCFGRQMLEESL